MDSLGYLMKLSFKMWYKKRPFDDNKFNVTDDRTKVSGTALSANKLWVDVSRRYTTVKVHFQWNFMRVRHTRRLAFLSSMVSATVIQ